MGTEEIKLNSNSVIIGKSKTIKQINRSQTEFWEHMGLRDRQLLKR